MGMSNGKIVAAIIAVTNLGDPKQISIVEWPWLYVAGWGCWG